MNYSNAYNQIVGDHYGIAVKKKTDVKQDFLKQICKQSDRPETDCKSKCGDRMLTRFGMWDIEPIFRGHL